jgi:hypothetical protein
MLLERNLRPIAKNNQVKKPIRRSVIFPRLCFIHYLRFDRFFKFSPWCCCCIAGLIVAGLIAAAAAIVTTEVHSGKVSLSNSHNVVFQSQVSLILQL